VSIFDHIPCVRLRWDGRHGAAITPQSQRVLLEKPDVGFRFVELDYAPGICCQVRRETWHQLDDMRPDERDACTRYLQQDMRPIDTTTGLVSGGPVFGNGNTAY
jgi:hypothetical protein